LAIGFKAKFKMLLDIFRFVGTATFINSYQWNKALVITIQGEKFV